VSSTSGIISQGFWRNSVIFLACLGLLLTLDGRIMELIKQAQDPHLFLFKWATTIGYGENDLLIAAVFAFVGYRRRNSHALQAGKLALLAVLVSGVASQILKHRSCRSRPYMADAGVFHLFPCFKAGLASFPSGHVSTTVALAVVLIVPIPRGRYRLSGLPGLWRCPGFSSGSTSPPMCSLQHSWHS